MHNYVHIFLDFKEIIIIYCLIFAKKFLSWNDKLILIINDYTHKYSIIFDSVLIVLFIRKLI